MNKIFRCVTCDEVFFKTPFDHAPEYRVSSEISSHTFCKINKNDLRDFMRRHRGHVTEHLDLIRGSCVSEKNYSEPVNTFYYKATNGRDRFVIKKCRERIDEPLRYELIHGDYSLECTGIEIQSEAIVRELTRHFQTAPLSKAEIAAFLKLYHRVSETMDIQDLEQVVQGSPSHPLERYYKPDDVSVVYLLRNCRRMFKEERYLQIENFINRHFEDGIFLLKTKYRIQINERPKTSREIPVPVQTEPELLKGVKAK